MIARGLGKPAESRKVGPVDGLDARPKTPGSRPETPAGDVTVENCNGGLRQAASDGANDMLRITTEELMDSMLDLLSKDDPQVESCLELIAAVRSEAANGGSNSSLLCIKACSAPGDFFRLVEERRREGPSLKQAFAPPGLDSLAETPHSPGGRAMTPDQKVAPADSANTTHTPAVRNQLPFFPDASNGDLRVRCFLLFEDASKSLCGKGVTLTVMLTIVVSTVSFLMETMPEYRFKPPECDITLPKTAEACEPIPLNIFAQIEVVCIAIFTVDYLARILTVHAYDFKEKIVRPRRSSGFFITGEVQQVLQQQDMGLHQPKLSQPVVKRFKKGLRTTLDYTKQPLNIVDFLAIIPYYIEIALGSSGLNMAVVRVLRLLRVLRIMKMGKHNGGMQMFAEVIVMSAPAASILMFFNIIGVVLFGALMYFCEGRSFSVDKEFTGATQDGPAPHPTGVYYRDDASGESVEPTPFRSIPYACWWALTTMTTVGYGDMFPTTRLGKVIGVFCFYAGILLVALPITVLGANFEIVYAETYSRPNQESPESFLAEGEGEKQQCNGASGTSVASKARRTSVTRGSGLLPQCPGIRKKIFLLFEDPDASKLSKLISIFVMTTIIVSTVAFIMESMPVFNSTPDKCDVQSPTVEDCEPQPAHAFFVMEAICITIFTVDYVCKALTVHSAEPHECGLALNGHVTGLSLTWKYETQWLNMIDVAAIIPFYIELIAGGSGGSLSFLRVLRLVRVFRVLRMPKLKSGVVMFGKVIMDSVPAMSILLFMTMLGCVLFASCMFFAEGTSFSVNDFPDDYPDGTYVRPTVDGRDVEPSPFKSIPHAFWWFFTTATTVGYGDYFPTTTAGRLVAICAFYAGIVLLALPITILGGAFTEHYGAWAEEYDIGGRKEARDEESEEVSAHVTDLSVTDYAEPGHSS